MPGLGLPELRQLRDENMKLKRLVYLTIKGWEKIIMLLVDFVLARSMY